MRRTALATALGLAAATTVSLAGPVLAATPTCGGKPATIVGTADDDVLVGTRGRDVIVGLGGEDKIRGRGGDDLICGGLGRDVLRGGPGADLLDVGPWAGDEDLVTYDTAARGIRADMRVGTVTGQGRDRVVGEHIALHGSPYADELTAGPAIGELAGLGGDDLIVGGAGDDSIHPGRGDDVVFGGAGGDVVYAYAWPDRPSGSDTIDGGEGDDWIGDVVGPHDRDQYRGGSGEDKLWLRTRFVRDGRVTYPNGRMRLDGRWTTYGGRHAEGLVHGVEHVTLPIGRWRLVGTDAAEKLWAPRYLNDPQRRGVTILGGGGDDNLIGTEYDDVLLGEDGTDMACGRGGNDEIESEEQEVNPIYLCDPR